MLLLRKMLDSVMVSYNGSLGLLLDFLKSLTCVKRCMCFCGWAGGSKEVYRVVPCAEGVKKFRILIDEFSAIRGKFEMAGVKVE